MSWVPWTIVKKNCRWFLISINAVFDWEEVSKIWTKFKTWLWISSEGLTRIFWRSISIARRKSCSAGVKAEQSLIDVARKEYAEVAPNDGGTCLKTSSNPLGKFKSCANNFLTRLFPCSKTRPLSAPCIASGI